MQTLLSTPVNEEFVQAIRFSRAQKKWEESRETLKGGPNYGSTVEESLAYGEMLQRAEDLLRYAPLESLSEEFRAQAKKNKSMRSNHQLYKDGDNLKFVRVQIEMAQSVLKKVIAA